MAVADVVPDGTAPVMTDEYELGAPQLFCQIGNVIGKYVDGVVLDGNSITFQITNPKSHQKKSTKMPIKRNPKSNLRI